MSTGWATLSWLSEAEVASLRAMPPEKQWALLQAAQDVTSGDPKAPGYSYAARAHKIKGYHRLLRAVAGPVRKGLEDPKWSKVEEGLPGPRPEGSRAGAHTPARARPHLQLVDEDDPEGNSADEDEPQEDVPRFVWPPDWSPRRCRAADYFLAGHTYAEVSRATGITAATASKWWNGDPEFRRQIALVRSQLNEHRAQRLNQLGDGIIARLNNELPYMTARELIQLFPHVADRIGLVKTERVEVSGQVEAAPPNPEEAAARLAQAAQTMEDVHERLRQIRERRNAITVESEG